MFIISGEKVNIGEVLCINNEVSELLGYRKEEIIGHDIATLMPPMIAEKHSQIMVKFFCSGKYSPEKDRMVLPLHNQGYIIPCWFLHRIVPNLNRGLQLIGFLHKISDFSECCQTLEKNVSPDDVVIMLTDKKWALQAFNIRASKLFGIDPKEANLRKYISSEEKVPICKFLPELEDENYLREAVNGKDTILDIELIKKVISTEIETRGNNPENHTSRSKESPIPFFLPEDLSSITEKGLRGPLYYSELQYGKYSEQQETDIDMKLVMIYLEQLIEKEEIATKEPRSEQTLQKTKLYISTANKLQ